MTAVAKYADLVPVLEQDEVERLAELEEVVERGMKTFLAVGTALAEIRDNRLYRAEHGTFEDYCQARWNLARNRAYQIMEAAAVVQNFGHGEGPKTESQARELAKVPEDKRADVWRETVERTNGKPTAAAVRETAAPVTPSPAPAPAKPEPAADPPQPRPADPADTVSPEARERIERERGEQASREGFSRSLARAVWHLAQYAEQVDHVQVALDKWEPTQDVYPAKTTAERLRAAGEYLIALSERWPK